MNIYMPASALKDQQVFFRDGSKESKLEINEQANPHILLVSYYCPSRAHAGGLRILDIYALIRKQKPNVQLDVLTFHREEIDGSLDDVYSVFDNVYLSESENLTPEVLVALSGFTLIYDVIDLQFHQLGNKIKDFRAIGKRIVYSPMESQCSSLFINLKIALTPIDWCHVKKLISSFKYAVEEIFFALKADQVLCVSDADANSLRKIKFLKKVIGVDTGISPFEFSGALGANFIRKSSLERRCNILYVAYFGSETNLVALRWYLDKIHPIIKMQVPEYIFTVVGRGDLSEFFGYKDGFIEFVGEVTELSRYIDDARVGIAPALSGAGFRGKVSQYSIMGVPSVVSPIAYNGLAYRHGEHIFVAQEAEDFAERCIELLTDLKLNDLMGQAARKLCLDNYSWQSKWPLIEKVYNLGLGAK